MHEDEQRILLGITVDDYWETDPSEIMPDIYVHKFFTEISVNDQSGKSQTVVLHVKFEIAEIDSEKNIERTLVISFHPAERRAEYAFRI